MLRLLLHVPGVVSCTHQAPAAAPPSQTRVLAGGQPLATASDQIAVTGCPFQVPVPGGTKPQPCVKILWSMPSTKVSLSGQPALLAPAPGTGAGVCQSVEQIPQGPPVVKGVQARVGGL